MRVSLIHWNSSMGWQPAPDAWPADGQLVLYFGAREVLENTPVALAALRQRWPSAVCAGCSTAGEITGTRVTDGTIVAAVVQFSTCTVRGTIAHVTNAEASAGVARQLAHTLLAPDLRHVLVISDGLNVNGSTLAAGFREVLPAGVQATGGLAGDSAAFQKTFVGLGADCGSHRVVALGFYGAKLSVRWGSAGGWQAFGPRRLVTRSRANLLCSLDDQPALELYKRYLGPRATDLPASGLLYPLQLLPERDSSTGLVRTILAIDEAAQSLTFAGDIPEGSYVRLMRAGHDSLVNGAATAASHARSATVPAEELAVLVSCVGRKLVMGQRIEEEVEAALAALGPHTTAFGFYSYGELCPTEFVPSCELHNQTMTLTVFAEAP